MADSELVLVPVGEWDPSLWSETTLMEALDFGRYRINRVDGSIKLIISDDQIGNGQIKYDINKAIDKLEEKHGVKFILVKRIIDSEKGYVRRTAEQFAAGAVPSKPGYSHRLKSAGLKVTGELHEAIKAAAELHNVDRNEFMRAAIRAALRRGIDVQYELETPVEVDLPEPEEPSVLK